MKKKNLYAKKLSKTHNSQKNKKLVQEIQDNAIDLNNEIKKISINENEKANEILDTVHKLLSLMSKIKKEDD